MLVSMKLQFFYHGKLDRGATCELIRVFLIPILSVQVVSSRPPDADVILFIQLICITTGLSRAAQIANCFSRGVGSRSYCRIQE